MYQTPKLPCTAWSLLTHTILNLWLPSGTFTMTVGYQNTQWGPSRKSGYSLCIWQKCLCEAHRYCHRNRSLSALTDRSAGWFMCCVLTTSTTVVAESNRTNSLTVEAKIFGLITVGNHPLRLMKFTHGNVDVFPPEAWSERSVIKHAEEMEIALSSVCRFCFQAESNLTKHSLTHCSLSSLLRVQGNLGNLFVFFLSFNEFLSSVIWILAAGQKQDDVQRDALLKVEFWPENIQNLTYPMIPSYDLLVWLNQALRRSCICISKKMRC